MYLRKTKRLGTASLNQWWISWADPWVKPNATSSTKAARRGVAELCDPLRQRQRESVKGVWLWMLLLLHFKNNTVVCHTHPLPHLLPQTPFKYLLSILLTPLLWQLSALFQAGVWGSGSCDACWNSDCYNKRLAPSSHTGHIVTCMLFYVFFFPLLMFVLSLFSFFVSSAHIFVP